MTRFAFNAQSGLVIIAVEITGPSGSAIVRLALDTGATRTLVNNALLVAVGCDLSQGSNRVEMTTGSGVEYASLITIDRITALGQSRDHFPVLAHTLPPSAGVDGVLGLDFLRDLVVTLDFLAGEIGIQ